jgi:hypothetical protein
MAECDVCGNDYDKAFTVTVAGRQHTFEASQSPTPSAQGTADAWAKHALKTNL